MKTLMPFMAASMIAISTTLAMASSDDNDERGEHNERHYGALHERHHGSEHRLARRHRGENTEHSRRHGDDDNHRGRHEGYEDGE